MGADGKMVAREGTRKRWVESHEAKRGRTESLERWRSG